MNLTPRERKDIPWIVGIGIAVVLIGILIVAYFGT
jgi:hypothetical protein